MVMRRYIQLLAGMLLLLAFRAHAEDIYPAKPNPPRLVNDLAGVLSGAEANGLEQKLDAFANSSSTQVTVLTVKDLGGQDAEEYAVEVFNRWQLGQQGKNNGVLLLVSINDRKGFISVGRGLQGVLTDAKTGQIFRNQLVPPFKEGNYYQGISDACDAIIAVTKGEYSGDGAVGRPQHIPGTAIIIIIIFIIFILRLFRGGGGGGGNYMSGGGFGNFMTGMFLGNMLGGGWGRGGDGGGDWGGGGGGFGGFGGGSTDGGGAGGSW
jgi:uncharacterized protein